MGSQCWRTESVPILFGGEKLLVPCDFPMVGLGETLLSPAFTRGRGWHVCHHQGSGSKASGPSSQTLHLGRVTSVFHLPGTHFPHLSPDAQPDRCLPRPLPSKAHPDHTPPSPAPPCAPRISCQPPSSCSWYFPIWLLVWSLCLKRQLHETALSVFLHCWISNC